MSPFDQAELLDERTFRFRFTGKEDPYRGGGAQRFWHGALIEYVYSVPVHQKLATASLEAVQDQICGVKNSVFGVYAHDDRLKNKACNYAVPKRLCEQSFTWWSVVFECAGDTNDVFVTKRAQTLGDQFCFRPESIELVAVWSICATRRK